MAVPSGGRARGEAVPGVCFTVNMTVTVREKIWNFHRNPVPDQPDALWRKTNR
jgi:hypothetical protein